MNLFPSKAQSPTQDRVFTLKVYMSQLAAVARVLDIISNVTLLLTVNRLHRQVKRS